MLYNAEVLQKLPFNHTLNNFVHIKKSNSIPKHRNYKISQKNLEIKIKIKPKWKNF